MVVGSPGSSHTARLRMLRRRTVDLEQALRHVLDQRNLVCTAYGKRPCHQCSVCEARMLLGQKPV